MKRTHNSYQKCPWQKVLWLLVEWKLFSGWGWGGGLCLPNQVSTFICIMHGPLWGCKEGFSSPFIFYILGTQQRRLTSHNISNHITCDQSNVVIILRPYSFPSNECKSTPSLLASDSSWQRGCYSYNGCLIHPPTFCALLWGLFSYFFLLLTCCVADGWPTAKLALVWHLIMPSRLCHEGDAGW